MSRVLIQQYLADLARLRQVSGSDRAKFNTYRFADCNDKVIDLLARVTRVSAETQRIVEAVRSAPR